MLRSVHEHPRARGHRRLRLFGNGHLHGQAGRTEVRAAARRGTNNPDYAQTDPKTNQPAQNASRNIWVTETALSTALNTSYMATQLSLFSLVVGIALVLAGIGFVVLAFGATMPGRSSSIE